MNSSRTHGGRIVNKTLTKCLLSLWSDEIIQAKLYISFLPLVSLSVTYDCHLLLLLIFEHVLLLSVVIVPLLI